MAGDRRGKIFGRRELDSGTPTSRRKDHETREWFEKAARDETVRSVPVSLTWHECAEVIARGMRVGLRRGK